MIAEVSVKPIQKKIPNKRYTLEEYFKLEEKAPFKSEFVNGKIIPMAGGTIEHGKITGMIYALLLMLSLKKDKALSVFNSEQKVYLSAHHKIVYPDACAVVGATETYQGGNQAITNPTLIIEVASKSTEKYDRTGKFRLYQSLPSFQEYMLVSQDTPIVEVFYKLAENKWQMTTYIGLDKTVELETLGVSLEMADIYQLVSNLKDPQSIIDFPEAEEK